MLSVDNWIALAGARLNQVVGGVMKALTRDHATNELIHGFAGTRNWQDEQTRQTRRRLPSKVPQTVSIPLIV